MRQSRWMLIWAIVATVLLVVSVAWPEATRSALNTLSQNVGTTPVQAQTPDSPAQLEWLGWMFFRLTSPKGKVILFSPWLNDPASPFRNRESPLTLENIDVAHVILVPSGMATIRGTRSTLPGRPGRWS